jgi:hypothetical protein
LFGHIHESYGIVKSQMVEFFINASLLNREYQMTNIPISIKKMNKIYSKKIALIISNQEIKRNVRFS